MSHSFFLGTDAEVYFGSRFFSLAINAAWADYGLLESQALAYAELDQAYAEAFRAAASPATRTPARVVAKRSAKARLKAMASDLAKIIAGQPHVTDGQRLTLGLSVRGPRRPVGAPGRPYDFKWVLTGLGSLDLRWRCKHPPGASGTTYKLSRRVNGEGAFSLVAIVGRRRFSDLTVPAGAASVAYQIQPIRSTKVGETAEFNVNFGVSAGAPTTATRVAA